jgi:hypothetical protein
LRRFASCCCSLRNAVEGGGATGISKGFRPAERRP